MPVDQEFFIGKRSWSKIKDEVLAGYLHPYLSKVARLGRPILLVDGFAGQGVFEDGSPGSPLLICQAAEQRARGRYKAVFVNKDRAHHQKLESILEKANYTSVVPMLNNSATALIEIFETITNHTVFVYLDPFGVSTTFEQLVPFLSRSQRYSTEIVINLSMPITHRLAAYKAISNGTGNTRKIEAFHNRMTAVFGGDYWRSIYLSDQTPKEKEAQVMELYQQQLRNYLPFVGACPVRQTRNGATKYYITFASRHRDSMLLMNEAMCMALGKAMHIADWGNTLFAQNDWKTSRQTGHLRQVILEMVANYPGETRLEIWHRIVEAEFMRYIASEYRQYISELAKSGELNVVYTETKKLNDDCRFYPVD